MPVRPERAPDCVYSGNGGPTLSNLATDDSGLATNMTTGSSSIYEASSTRADLIETRTVDFLSTFNDTDTGYMWIYSTGSMRLASGGVVDLYVNGSSVLSHTIANLTAATDEDIVISWAMEPNPLTTGASDAYRSELHVWNITLGTYESSSATHAQQTSPGAGVAFVWGARNTSDGSPFTGSMYEVRLCSSFHSSTETAACYVDNVYGAAFGTGPVWEPDLRTLYDRRSTVTGSTGGSPSYDYETGGLEFSGQPDLASWSDPYDLSGNAFSISIWYHADSGVDIAGVIPVTIRDQATNNIAVRFGVTSGAYRSPWFRITYDTTSLERISNGAIYDLPWDAEPQHIVLTSDGSATAANHTIYVNGDAVTSYTSSIDGVGTAVNRDGDFRLSDSIGYVYGQLFHPKIYDIELTAAQVADTYRREKPPAGVRKLEFPVPDRASGIGNDGELEGPVLAMAAKAQQKSDLRLCGPLVNEVTTGDWAEDSTWVMTDPDDASFEWHAELIKRRPVPLQCNRVVFRAHVQQNDAAADDLVVRFYVSDRPGLIQAPASPNAPTRYYDTVTRNADDGTSVPGGAWIYSDPIRIARDDDNFSYFWIGLDGSAVTDYRVRAWSVEPIYDDDPTAFGGGGGIG